MELLRVFNKKRLCIFGLMIILNAVLFIMGNKINNTALNIIINPKIHNRFLLNTLNNSIGIWLIAIMTI